MDDSMDSDSAESGMSETNDTSFETDTKSGSLEILKTELYDCLVSLQSAGTFALFEHLPNPVNPGLYVKGVGTVGLPLSDRDAKAIKEAFGKQPEKEPFELNPRNFATKNPAWQIFIDGVIPRIMSGLGIEHEGGTVRLELSAMRLYDKNSKLNLFKHDSKKDPETFGDLAICLPSKHKGGEIIVNHIGQSKIYETDRYSEYDSSLMAWYSDVILDKKYIKSDQQLMLFYTLHYIGRAAGSASKAIEGSAKLSKLFASWKTDYKQNLGPEVLAYRLDHKVTAALCNNALEGQDRQIVKFLQEACSLNGFYLYLAVLERKVDGDTEMYDDYDEWRCNDDEHRSIIEERSVVVKLTEVANLDGVVIGQDIKITDNEIIQDGLFEREPDEEHHDYGCDSSTHYYRETAAIIVPAEARLPFFLGTERNLTTSRGKTMENMKNWLMNLSNDLDKDSSNSMAAEDLVHACRIVTSTVKQLFSKPLPPYSYDIPDPASIVELLCKISLRLAETSFLDTAQTLFLDILAFDFSQMPQTSNSSSVFPTFGRGIAVFGLQSSEPILSVSMRLVSSLHRRCSILEALAAGYKFEKWGQPLSDKLDSSKSEAGIASSLGIEDIDFSTWINGCYRQALTQCEIGEDEDVTCLSKIAAAFGAEFLLHSITSSLKKHMRTSGELVMAFMKELMKTSDEFGPPPAAAVEAFREVLPDVVKNLNLRVVQPNGNKRQKMDPGMHHGMNYNRVPSESVGKPIKMSQNIADILSQCVTLGLISEADQIISKMLSEIHKIPVEHIDEVVLVFLKRVLTQISKQEANLTNSRFQLLFQHSLAIYIDRFVQVEPAKPTNWTRPTRGCGCIHCKDLDAFLRSPNTQEFRCNSGVKPRAHLEALLAQDYGDFKFETDKRRSPHTLIITKTTLNGQYTREHQAWDQRAKMAVARMTELGVEPLKKLLGDQFDATFGLKWIRLGAHNSVTRPLNRRAQVPADDIEVITID